MVIHGVALTIRSAATQSRTHFINTLHEDWVIQVFTSIIAARLDNRWLD